MKYIIAVILTIVTVASTEPPTGRGFPARQQIQPSYPVRGLRPAGSALNLPLRSERQQLPPTPAASYGPPPQNYGPPAEPTTTETPTTTESVETTTVEKQDESFRVSPTNEKLLDDPFNPAAVYVIVPQAQSLMYTGASATSANLARQVQQPRLIPVQAVPAFAKVQEVPQFAQIVNFQAVAPLAAISIPSAAYTSIVNTPFSSTFVQSFQ